MTLSWFSIVRLGLIQMCLGAIVVLMTSTLNRLMVVELSLPALIPGFLVALHYGVQLSRPNWGYLSDVGGKRSFWVNSGMALLVTGAVLASFAIGIFPASYVFGMVLSVIAYILIGFGVGAAGTSVLALLGSFTAPHRRAAAATITWLMMIFGIAATAGIVGSLIDPYSHSKLMIIVACLGGIVMVVVLAAVWGLEEGLTPQRAPETSAGIIAGVKEVWSEAPARNFTIFVFLSMTAYFMQELILEPYSGLVFEYTPGQSTSLSGLQNGGVFVGMLSVGILATGLRWGALRSWVVLGCLGSAVSLGLIVACAFVPGMISLNVAVVTLGFFNGVFAVSAIGSMMALADQGQRDRVGTRMGLWGAAQAIAAAVGGLSGAIFVDILRATGVDVSHAFGIVFLFEASLFVYAALMARACVKQPAIQAALVAGE